MTIRTEVECDAIDCHNSTEINDNYNSDAIASGYKVDPNDEWTHYGSSCWPKVKKELDELEG